MKIIDQTPFIDEKGALGFSQRVQGMLQFGLNWASELKAQQVIANYFDRNIEKGYTLIRNQSLGQSGITIPMILVGSAGIFAINITYLRGRYEAKGNEWNVESGNQFKPARDNVIQKTATMARALTAYIERQGTKLPAPVEPVLIAAEPGLHIDTDSPAVKVLMSDGIRNFVGVLKSGASVMRADIVLELVERITNPRPARAKHSADHVSTPAITPPPSQPPLPSRQPEPQNVSRARAIFSAAEDANPVNPNDFDFAMAEDESAVRALSQARGGSVSPSGTKRARRILGMTLGQIAFLFAMILALVCILAAFGYLLFNAS
ncbi:MAG: NERD domain-containing protein [Anaerolineales bacterium]|nr:NERD domain-containing protein [Anaerolineales bacterium]